MEQKIVGLFHYSIRERNILSKKRIFQMFGKSFSETFI